MITTQLATHGAVLAQLNPHSADPLRDTGLGIIISVTIVVLGALLLKSLGTQRYGAMIAVLGAGAVVIGAAAMPDVTVSVLTGLYGQMFGGR